MCVFGGVVVFVLFCGFVGVGVCFCCGVFVWCVSFFFCVFSCAGICARALVFARLRACVCVCVCVCGCECVWGGVQSRGVSACAGVWLKG